MNSTATAQLIRLDWPLMKNNITREDLDAVCALLNQEDPVLTQSRNVRAFERETFLSHEAGVQKVLELFGFDQVLEDLDAGRPGLDRGHRRVVARLAALAPAERERAADQEREHDDHPGPRGPRRWWQGKPEILGLVYSGWRALAYSWEPRSSRARL